ncbi:MULTISPECIES: hypothetical protein [Myxococcus]|uniref:hypothetical protein n=1 Tax=Myxococcus TaxID=32 RepID=UPI00114293BA|nr:MULTISPECIES: hypothetical protein [Myxococcus]NOK02958.1 hypothetical protein [Myxococcus xanthus]
MTCFSLRELIVEARLGGAAVSMGRDDVRQRLGAPDQWGVEETVERASIWRYGNFELHFGEDGRCWMIFSDYAQEGLDAGPGRTLDLWLFADGPDDSVVSARLRADGLSVDEGIERDRRRLRVGAAKLFFDHNHLAVLVVTGEPEATLGAAEKLRRGA